MTTAQMASYRDRLRKLIERLQRDASTVSQQAFGALSGQAAGELSSAPTHLGDVGTEAYLQELNATLLENQEYLVKECLAAAQRIAEGTFGCCENCGKQIARVRLDAIPSTRHCTACAETLNPGPQINLNSGRPDDHQGMLSSRQIVGERSASAAREASVRILAGSNAGKANPTASLKNTRANRQFGGHDNAPDGRPRPSQFNGDGIGTDARDQTRNDKAHRARRLRRS